MDRTSYCKKLNTGTIFGKLVVIEDVSSGEVVCLCECATPVIATRAQLKRGTRVECGECIGREKTSLCDRSARYKVKNSGLSSKQLRDIDISST